MTPENEIAALQAENPHLREEVKTRAAQVQELEARQAKVGRRGGSSASQTRWSTARWGRQALCGHGPRERRVKHARGVAGALPTCPWPTAYSSVSTPTAPALG